MAIKAADQVSIVDITDAYSVILTSESHTFPGSTTAALAGSVATQIVAMCGNEVVAAKVDLMKVAKPSGVSVVSDNDPTSPTLTISVDTSVKTAGIVKIPVAIGDVTISKDFSFAIALKGQAGTPGADGRPGADGKPGADGAPGADAITMSVTSSNGTIFKNSAISTVLTAHVYKAGVELNTSQIAALGAIKWYKDGATSPAATGSTLTISPGQVNNKATYVAQLEA